MQGLTNYFEGDNEKVSYALDFILAAHSELNPMSNENDDK
jgi:hypothetical protein